VAELVDLVHVFPPKQMSSLLCIPESGVHHLPGAGDFSTGIMGIIAPALTIGGQRLQVAVLQRDRSQDMRFILSVLSQQATLANCNCRRTLTNGVLSESVALDGVQGTITDDELEAFIQSFPIA